MRKAWLLLVPLAVGGCQSTSLVIHSTTVPVNEERKVGGYYSLHEDCSSAGPTVVRIKSEPAHGTVSIREGREYPNFGAANPRNVCNRQSAPATLVFYRPSAGYVGTDSVDIDVIYPDGVNRQYHTNIVVK